MSARISGIHTESKGTYGSPRVHRALRRDISCEKRRVARLNLSQRPRQYTSTDFAALARANGVILSFSRKGECWDNAVAENFFATIERELINDRAWPTRAGLHEAVLDYIEGWYNTRRLHSALGYLSPAEYESAHHNADRQAA